MNFLITFTFLQKDLSFIKIPLFYEKIINFLLIKFLWSATKVQRPHLLVAPLSITELYLFLNDITPKRFYYTQRKPFITVKIETSVNCVSE